MLEPLALSQSDMGTPTTSTATCRSLTHDDLLQFARELKAEGFTPLLAISSFPELEALKMLKQNAAFNIPSQIMGDVRAHTALDMQYELACAVSTNADSWRIATETYNRLRYYSHLNRCRPLPRRKLRKCHLRKVDRFLKQERRRYL
jgi:hypothetical protein